MRGPEPNVMPSCVRHHPGFIGPAVNRALGVSGYAVRGATEFRPFVRDPPFRRARGKWGLGSSGTENRLKGLPYGERQNAPWPTGAALPSEQRRRVVFCRLAAQVQ
jgi:hypothetical protein